MNDPDRYLHNWLSTRIESVAGGFVMSDHLAPLEYRAATRLLADARRRGVEVRAGAENALARPKLSNWLCEGCGRHFSGERAFVRHRVGEYDIGHRCLTDDELRRARYTQSAKGVWFYQKGRPHPFLHAARTL